MSDFISATFFDTFAKIFIRIGIPFHTSQAKSSIPFIWISSCNSKSMFLRNWRFSLSKILWLTEDVLSNRLKVLNSFLNYYRFWEYSVNSFWMEWKTCALRNFLFSITKSMLCFRDWPNIVSMLLFTRSKSSMCLIVHRWNFRSFLLFSTFWIKNILCTFTTNGRHSESKFLLFSDWR